MPPLARPDAYAVEVARAVAGGDRTAAAAWVATMARYAAETGRARYREVAGRFAAAGPFALAQLPGLIWGAAA